MSGYDPDKEVVGVYTTPGTNYGLRLMSADSDGVQETALQHRIQSSLYKTLQWRGLMQLVLGLLTLIFGSLAMYFYHTIGQLGHWPMSSGSGIWAGLCAFVGGCFTIHASKVAEEETLTKANPKLKRWMGCFLAFSIMTLSTCIQHTIYCGQAFGQIWTDDASLVMTTFMEMIGIMLIILAISNIVWQYTKGKKMGIAQRRCCT